MQEKMKTIREAATALCDQWDTPLWKDAKHTSVLVHELRTALAQPEQEPVVFARRWKLAIDGFGLQQDDDNGNYVDIDDALSVLHCFASMQSDLTERDRKSYQKGHNDGVAHHKQAVKAAQPEQEPVVCCGDYATCMKSCTPRGRWLAEQEPVAWMCCAFDGKVCEQSNHDECENPIPLYTAPPAQPEQKPYGWIDVYGHFWNHKTSEDDVPLYTTPPRREWVGLTDAEAQLIYDMGRTPSGMMEMVESKLKEKNTWPTK